MLLKQIKKIDIPKADKLKNSTLYHLVASYLLITLPTISMFPIWLFGIALFSVILKIIATKQSIKIPSTVPVLIAGVALFFIFSNFSVFGRENIGIAMLYVFASIKLLETKSQRDSFLLMLINLLLMLGVLTLSESFTVFIYLFFCFIYNFYIQLVISQPKNRPIDYKKNLKNILKITAIAMPFVIILFFFFPRMTPLWQQQSKPIAQTGLSEEMTPSSMAILAQSDGIALKVEFENRKPPNNQLYWRGPVLTRFDGKTWHRGLTQRKVRPYQKNRRTLYLYKTTVDGSTNNWPLPLDLPASIPTKAEINANYEVESKKTITKPTQFRFSSYTRYKATAISKQEAQQNTYLPPNIYPKTRELAKQIYSQANDNPANYINLLKQYLIEHEFLYSLEPLPGNDSIDNFLFKNKIGYCEHYASSFAFMLRAVGIPSRVVTGYQGGEVNPFSKIFEVRQLNAHAWVEAYIDGDGWVRIDPTAVVAPNRISDSNILRSLQGNSNLSLTEQLRNSSELVKDATNLISAANTIWQSWVSGFNQEKQNDLFEQLGLDDFAPLFWLILLIAAGILVAIIIYLYRKRKDKKQYDPVQIIIYQFIKKIEEKGIIHEKYQPLAEWVNLHKVALGKNYPEAKKIVDLYYLIRFSEQTNQLNALQNKVNQFKLNS